MICHGYGRFAADLAHLFRHVALSFCAAVEAVVFVADQQRGLQSIDAREALLGLLRQGLFSRAGQRPTLLGITGTSWLLLNSWVGIQRIGDSYLYSTPHLLYFCRKPTPICFAGLCKFCIRLRRAGAGSRLRGAIKALEQAGWVLVATRGSPRQFTHSHRPCRVKHLHAGVSSIRVSPDKIESLNYWTRC